MRFATALFVFGLAACRAADEGEALGDGKFSRNAVSYEGERIPLPDDGTDEATGLWRDRTRSRLWYRTRRGDVRVLYLVGKSAFIGPLMRAPVDWKAVPDLEHALGGVFAEARERRLQLATEVQRERGHGALVELLLAAVWVDGPEWGELRTQIVPADEKWFRDAMATKLDSNDPLVVARAAAEADLLGKGLTRLVADKAEQMVKEHGDPVATAALLQATLASSPDAAGKIGCAALAGRITDPLASTAALAIARSKAACAPERLEQLLDEPCSEKYRCSNHDLCTGEELAPEIARAAALRPDDLYLARGRIDRGPLAASRFAYAALLEQGALPPRFVRANARRKYEIQQPAAPPCDARGLRAWTPCHCDEGAIHEDACLDPNDVKGTSASCAFEMDDEKKLITNVSSRPTF